MYMLYIITVSTCLVIYTVGTNLLLAIFTQQVHSSMRPYKNCHKGKSNIHLDIRIHDYTYIGISISV